ncbi:GNAT family N-acetyltransferase [Micromonospora sp. LOL_023]|uniref:GNAT family N-acetyltransferase n=1 Tax=Micromonospora sp. LOL_023 TaxID=3345418 RepID=UPI003A8ADAAB
MTWESTRLTPDHDTSSFDCGVDSLNQWLIGHALAAQRSRSAATHVWTAPRSDKVMAYFATTPTKVVRAELSHKQADGSSDVPGYLLAKLAMHRQLHGQGLGGELLLDALTRLVIASEGAGGRLIVVDALDRRAARFYQHYGFTPVKGNPNRLVMKAATARNDLGLGSLAVTPNPESGLVSMVLNLPDGQAVPFVGDAAEARRVAEELFNAAEAQERQGTSSAGIDLRQVFTRALGRDPFVDPS